MTDTLQSLLERLENAEKPDREIDALIRCTLLAPSGAYVEQSPHNGEWCVYEGTDSKSGRQRLWEPRNLPWQIAQHGVEFTDSLDAAVGLVEWTLPEYTGFIGYKVGTETWIWPAAGNPKGIRLDVKTTAALTLLTALFQALIAEQE